jgi:S1-C subfamily serine protease
VIDAAGYLCTNYHVIEAAYNLQQAERIQQQQTAELFSNLSSLSGARFDVDRCQSARRADTAQVYVRIDSQTRYRPCRIVDVVPELDVAVLKIDNEASDDRGTTGAFNALVFGSSGSLLVGQQLIAIGNPFGLDNTVTTGVVSALNREIQVGGGRLDPRRFMIRMMPSRMTIRNCIQTDCAINPGNSGGPLLNRQGQVIGMNTAIVTTSGSNAGIGFAVPADLIQPEVQRIVRSDQQRLRPSVFLGVQIVKCRSASGLDKTKSGVTLAQRPWVVKVEPNSPAANAGVAGLEVDESTGRVTYGDAIVAIGGNVVRDFAEIQAELDRRRVGEQIQLTLEDKEGNRRVVYLTLSDTNCRR